MKLQVCPRVPRYYGHRARLSLQTAVADCWMRVDAAAPTETKHLRNTDRIGQSSLVGPNSWSTLSPPLEVQVCVRGLHGPHEYLCKQVPPPPRTQTPQDGCSVSGDIQDEAASF